MRIPSSVFAVGRYLLAAAAVLGSVALMSASNPKKTEFSVHDKAYYAAQATVNFVRPGLTMKIVSANIAQDGTISVDYKITDPKLAYVENAKQLALMAVDMLWDGAKNAKGIIAEFKPRLTKEAYLSFQRGINKTELYDGAK